MNTAVPGTRTGGVSASRLKNASSDTSDACSRSTTSSRPRFQVDITP